MVRPFLQKAAEFEARQPLVAYYLKTHVAYLCMKKRTKEDREGTAYVMNLLTALEKIKAAEPETSTSDGRTVLTRTALMLFAKADDAERSGLANDQIVKMFFASSVLFEATGQYLEGELDPIAAEKRKYARFVALRMKKALDAGVPYVSPNAAEGSQHGADLPTAATTAFSQPQPPPQQQQVQPLPQPQLQQWQAPQPQSQPQQPPQWQPPQAQPQPPPPAQPWAPPVHQPQQQPLPQSSFSPPPPSQGFVPTQDHMIDAQKFAKQAVSALQFYDHANARKQLLAALALLDGRQ